MRAMVLATEQKYICERERELPDAEQTVFWFMDLTPSEKAHLQDMVVAREENGLKYYRGAEQSMRALHMGLVRVDGLTGADGKPVVLRRDFSLPRLPGGKHPWAEESLALIPQWAVGEVALHIINHSFLSDDETKN